ncbi:MAG: Rrf2 family transcriptional regulator [Deltaproteobacteria bacterium]|nr:Rrf2 family transcriptional regulator [Deltaproteobacteria bacterium]
MLHFNKKTEYALLAIEHMIRKEGQALPVTSTREISQSCHIPYPLLAKVMQRLAAHGVIRAFQGTKGGYVLAKPPGDITVAHVVEIFDGPFAVAECFNGEKITCPQWDGCLIKGPFYELNHKIYNLLAQTTVADLAGRQAKPALQESL